MGNLINKTALVTGGSRGIGEGIALRLAREGASVALTYVSAPQKAEAIAATIRAEGGQALAIRADAADAASIQNAVEETVKTLGGLDILVNNAGIAIMKPIDELSLDDFDRINAVNVRGVFAAIQAAVRHMPEGGRVITIGSVNGDRVPFPGGSLYGMTKAAVAGLTRGLARDLAAKGITINTVQPGPIHTDMNPSDGPMAAGMHATMAITRHGTLDEVASLVAYLAGPDASFITGASLNVDGGYNA